ncbi:type I restriction endonuclease [Runella sp.]|jgi:type I restriction enzyme R subunit|uniref:type I restriction endonuclease n=1 Tax=Runella sp. TaxID=1960881 RepID=UPI00301692AB
MNRYERVDPERVAQNRVVKLMREVLYYRNLGNLEEQENTNLREDDLRRYLLGMGRYTPALIQKALFDFQKAALINRNDELSDANKAVYSLLRYGIPVKEEAGQNKVTVQLIDWEQFENNDFAVAEEVTVKGEKIKRPDVVMSYNVE